MPEPRTAGARDHAIRYLEHFVTYQPGEWGRPRREKAESCLSTLLAALAQAERERDRYRAAIQQMVAQKSLLLPRIWQIGEDALAAAPPPEEEASHE